jgi:hypothetical protein
MVSGYYTNFALTDMLTIKTQSLKCIKLERWYENFKKNIGIN